MVVYETESSKSKEMDVAHPLRDMPQSWQTIITSIYY